MKLGGLAHFKKQDALKWPESKNNNGRKAKVIEIEFQIDYLTSIILEWIIMNNLC